MTKEECKDIVVEAIRSMNGLELTEYETNKVKELKRETIDVMFKFLVAIADEPKIVGIDYRDTLAYKVKLAAAQAPLDGWATPKSWRDLTTNPTETQGWRNERKAEDEKAFHPSPEAQAFIKRANEKLTIQRWRDLGYSSADAMKRSYSPTDKD